MPRRIQRYTYDELVESQRGVLDQIGIPYELMPDPWELRNWGTYIPGIYEYDEDTLKWKCKKRAQRLDGTSQKYRQARIIPNGELCQQPDLRKWQRNPGINLAWYRTKYNPNPWYLSGKVFDITNKQWIVRFGNASMRRVENEPFWLLDKQTMADMGIDCVFKRRKYWLQFQTNNDLRLSKVLRDLQAMGQDT